MLKINSKKKVNKPNNTLKPQFTQKKPLVQPEWNSTQSDLSQYKLSKAEQVQKKVSMISKHRYEAKELWLQRQEKLKKGIVDEETQTVMETCLLTKRPPERNTKNLSYFVKDDTYADYLNQAYEESEEKRLCMADLHQQQQQEKSEFKPKIEKSRIETTSTKQKNNQDQDEGDDFIRKVNESLKDARDFMTKMERYPSLSNPEKALKALTSVNKENHSRSSSSHTQSKPKPAAVNTSSTNLKSSLNNSQNGNKRNLSSSSGFKDSSPQLSKKANKVEEALPKTQPKSQPKSEEEYEEEEVSAPKEQNVEKGEDISNYFKSLNQIEDTIKFLEENIMGGGSSVPENKAQEDFDYKPPSALQRFGFEDLTIKSPIMNNKIQEYSPQKIEEKDEEEDSYFKKPSPKHHESDHEDDHEKELSHDDEQISFALTMRSNDQTERNYGHDQHNDHSYDKPDYASKLFGFNDVISPITASLKPFPIPIQQSSPEYPQTIFENKAIQERTRTQNVQPVVKPVVKHSPPRAQPVEEEEEDDDEDFNIERIKGLLQATKLEIDKMNTGQMESYNKSYKTALEDMDKENVSNNKGFSTLPKYSNFDDTYKSEYPIPMGKKIEVVRNEAFVTVKQPMNALWENQRKVLADVNNTRNMFDDDIPAPQTLDIKKQAVAMNYSPKKVDDVPFNFRSFRK